MFDIYLLFPFQIYDFDSGLNTTSYGTARDFNLMLANGAKGSLTSIFVEREYVLNEISCPNQFTIIIGEECLNIENNDKTYLLYSNFYNIQITSNKN